MNSICNEFEDTVESHVLIDSTRQTVVIEDLELKESTSFLVSNLYGTVYEDTALKRSWRL